jgi:hypothetical protein
LHPCDVPIEAVLSVRPSVQIFRNFNIGKFYKKWWNIQFLLKSDATSEISKRELLCVSACILHSLLVYQGEESSDGNVAARNEAYFAFNVIFYGFRCN